MPDQPIPAAVRSLSHAEEDDQLQAAIVSHTLFLYPAPLTSEEIVLDVIAGSQVFMERDAVQTALHCLLRDGVLRQDGKLILPVRPIVRFNQLRDAGV